MSRLVIFDFDGTLADSAAWLRSVINPLAKQYGFKPVAPEDFERLRGKDVRAILSELDLPTWKLPFVVRHLRKLAARDTDQIQLFPGADELLMRLSRSGITLAIVSSNNEPHIRRVLGAELSSTIKHYACGASLFGKARKLKQVLAESGAAPEHAFAVGDEVRDIEAARAHGVAALAVGWGYNTPVLLRTHAPFRLFERMDELAAFLTEG